MAKKETKLFLNKKEHKLVKSMPELSSLVKVILKRSTDFQRTLHRCSIKYCDIHDLNCYIKNVNVINKGQQLKSLHI